MMSRSYIDGVISFGCGSVTDSRDRAQGWFRSWNPKEGKIWLPQYYECPYFREIYASRIHPRRVPELLRMLRIYATSPQSSGSFATFLKSRIATDNTIRVKVMSFGCGPGTDAVAVIQFLKAGVEVLTDNSKLHLEVTLVDRVYGWRDEAEAAVKPHLDLASGDKVTFMIASWSDPQVVAVAAKADILITSHNLVDAATPQFGHKNAANRCLGGVLSKWRMAVTINSPPPPKLLIWVDKFFPDRFDIICNNTSYIIPKDLRVDPKSVHKKTCMGVIQDHWCYVDTPSPASVRILDANA